MGPTWIPVCTANKRLSCRERMRILVAKQAGPTPLRTCGASALGTLRVHLILVTPWSSHPGQAILVKPSWSSHPGQAILVKPSWSSHRPMLPPGMSLVRIRILLALPRCSMLYDALDRPTLRRSWVSCRRSWQRTDSSGVGWRWACRLHQHVSTWCA